MNNPLTRPPRVQKAAYQDTGLRAYDGNPYIEALPPILDVETAGRLLRAEIDYRPEDRLLPTHLRLHALQDILFWRQPGSLHVDLEQRFSRMIRTGYRGRNPCAQTFWSDIRSGRQHLTEGTTSAWTPRSTAGGFVIMGDSGTGKTCAVESVLALYPQVIIHHRYRDMDLNRLQVIYLLLQCPPKGGLVGLCHNFFREVDTVLDTHYFALCTRKGQAHLAEMVGHMYTVAQVHGIGVVVVDEIQNLTEAKANDAEAMLNFFVQLVNDLGVPLVPVGTPKAIHLLTSAFRQARRVSGHGDLIVKRFLPCAEWDLFVDQLWRYQYVQQPQPLTDELRQALYDETQGILDLLVKVFILAQVRAMTTSDLSQRERLTVQTIRSVRDTLTLLQPMLQALRSGDEAALSHYQDLYESVNIEAYLQEMLLQLPTLKTPAVPAATVLTRPSPASSRTKFKETVYQGSVPEVVAQGRAQNVTPYEALQRAGHIRPLDEYLPC